MQLPLKDRNLNAESRPSFCAGHKLGDLEQALLWSLLQEAPRCPSRVLLERAAEQDVVIAVSIRHVNRWRVAWHLNGAKGRPRHGEGYRPVAEGAEVIEITPRVSFVGVHVFAHWLEHVDRFGPVVAQLQEAVESHTHTHPDDDFALLHHREVTLKRRFAALLLAPLLGIERLSGFDIREHPLERLLGQGYHSSTLRQFLGQLERVDAGAWLLPVLSACHQGQLTYVDGHMVAYWSRVPMHKGRITMLGRIMSGSQAVIAHDETAQAVFVAYYAPDIDLSQLIVAYCQKVAVATGKSVFVIDRAANAVAIARAFAAQDLGLLCMLDDNEHDGLVSFEATEVGCLEDGTRLYSGPWKEPRADDPRHFVILEPAADKTLVYWGTPKVKAVLETSAWPGVYRSRNEIQENSFKRMIDHGALNINYGRKKIVGPDRHQQRARDKLETSLEAAQKRIDTKVEAIEAKQAQVAESIAHGHGRRLEQRQGALRKLETALQDAQRYHDQVSERVEALGAPGERADRDFRKQTIMTIRTLLLENALRAFMALLLGALQTKVSVACVLGLFFERSGACLETRSEVVYWVNTSGLSVPNQRVLTAIVDGLCAMDLRAHGKPLRVRLKAMPP